MNLGLSGKVALVTGASRGIGKAIALALSGEGASVAICARGLVQLRQAEKLLPDDRTLAIPADITNPGDIERVIAETVARFGSLDVLVCNAGGSKHPTVLDATDDDWMDGFSRNPLQVARFAKAAHPHLKESKGRILIVSSIWGRESGGSVIYNAMKAAEISMATSISREFASDGIGVNALCPGSTAFPGGSWQRRLDEDPSGMAAFIDKEIPLGRFGAAEEIAAAAVFLCSPAASWITGVALPVDGGQSRSNPR